MIEFRTALPMSLGYKEHASHTGPVCNISYINSNIKKHGYLDKILFARSTFVRSTKSSLSVFDVKDGFSDNSNSITMYYDEANDCFYADENKSMRMIFIYKSRLTSTRDKFFEYLTEKIREIYGDIITYENGIVITIPANEAMIIKEKIKKIIQLNLTSFLGKTKNLMGDADRTVSCIYDHGIFFEAYVLI